MLFSIQSIMAILAFSGSALAIPTHVNQVRQATENVVSLFAYGEDIKGMKLIYGDGLAYIINLGVDASSILSVKSDLNWITSGEATDVAWSAVETSLNRTETFYINTLPGSYEQAGFTSGDLGSGENSPGLCFVGTAVWYAAQASDYQQKFWAKKTSVTGLWSLMWNVDGVLEADSVPVVIKTTPPPITTN